MLEELIVRNLGLIAEAHLEPGNGLVVITGETGTGKTMLLGAVELLLGRNAASDLVGPAGDEAEAQGRFLLEEDGQTEEIVVSRRVVTGGRSRAYLDGEMVPARILGDRLEPRTELIKQGDARRISDPASFRVLVDGCLDAEGHDASRRYRDAWTELGRLRADQELLGGDTRALERELDLVRYQSEEIAEAGFDPGEDVELGQRADRLRYAGDLADALSEAQSHMENEDHLAAAVGAVRRAASFDPSLQTLSDQVDGLQVEWAEALSAVREVAATIEHNPEALAETEARLAQLGNLKRKYGDTLEAVLGFGAEAAKRVAEAEDLLQRAGDLDAELANAMDQVDVAGEALRAARIRAGKKLSSDAGRHLEDLGIAAPVLEVEVDPAPAGPKGADQVRLMFASDAALGLAPAHKSASGGELSRLILAVRLAGGASDAEVVVFDEVDAGVGGATALAMGEKLADLANARQVFCVTHLPQVAAFADRHLVVERQGAVATVRPVVEEDRVAELARMMAGLGESEKGRQHAVELLETAKARRG